jgi:signal transduction histidine kinase
VATSVSVTIKPRAPAGVFPRNFVRIQALVWLTYAVVHFAASLPAISDSERPVMAFASVIRALTGAFASSLIPVGQILRDKNTRWWLVSAIAIVATGGWMFLDRAILVTFAAIFDFIIPWGRFPRGMELEYLFVMLAWATGFAALTLSTESAAQREELISRQLQIQNAKLSLLAAQLNPHFLFNSLNTIKSLAAEDPARTREIVTRLASFLRRAIALDRTSSVPLQTELDLARDYLSVEEARFETGLEVSYDIDPDVNHVTVPPLILQPLLENAIKHGDADGDGVLRIKLSAIQTNEGAEIVISNTGKLSNQSGEGIGLPLTKSRLAHLYGVDHTFSLSQKGDRVIARMLIPLVLGTP